MNDQLKKLDDLRIGMTASNISRVFRGRRGKHFTALEGIDLEIKPNEFVCLLGPSGCGKSTLLHILAGLDQPSTGDIVLDGTPVHSPGPDRGFLFQQPSLFPWLTVLDNVLFGPRARHSVSSDTKKAADELLARVGLSPFATAYPHQLSGGMQHRVAFARALINQPSVLLLDEPFAALDAITRSSMQEFLLHLWDVYSMSIVFVTHDIAEAATLGSRVVVMATNPGRVHKVVDISLPRPRDRAVIESPAFLEVQNTLRHAVEEVLPVHSFAISEDGSQSPEGRTK